MTMNIISDNHEHHYRNDLYIVNHEHNFWQLGKIVKCHIQTDSFGIFTVCINFWLPTTHPVFPPPTLPVFFSQGEKIRCKKILSSMKNILSVRFFFILRTKTCHNSGYSLKNKWCGVVLHEKTKLGPPLPPPLFLKAFHGVFWCRRLDKNFQKIFQIFQLNFDRNFNVKNTVQNPFGKVFFSM